MGKINLPRVILGGLVAGVVMTAANFLANLIFADQMAAMFERLGVTEPGGAQIAVLIVFTFIAGIVLVWLYSAIRPRFGAGVQTAVTAAVLVWFFGSFSTQLAFHVLGLLTMGQFIVGAIFDLIVFAIAAVAGAWLYQEEAA